MRTENKEIEEKKNISNKMAHSFQMEEFSFIYTPSSAQTTCVTVERDSLIVYVLSMVTKGSEQCI